MEGNYGRLVLSRKVGERIRLSTSFGDVIVTVQNIGGSFVSLSFSGPPEVHIVREELLRKEATGG